MPRRICHILGSSGHEGTGIARIVASLHQHLDAEKYQLSACFVGTDGPLADKFQGLRIPTRVIEWHHPSRDILGSVRLLRFLRNERFDVLHFHWGGPTLRRMARLVTDARIVLHLHSPIEEGREVTALLISTSGSDIVIAVSESVAKVSSHANTRVVHSGVDIKKTTGPRNENKNTIGVAGRLAPIKGISYLIQSIAILRADFPDIQLRIAGDGPLVSMLQAEVKSLVLDGNVTFLGWLDHIASERSRWAVMVQPSLQEGLPMSVIEAMAEGVPVIASRVGGLSELIEHSVCGLLVEPADPQALAEAIRRLLLDPVSRHRMGDAAAVRVREVFSAPRMAMAVSSIYDDLLATRG